MKALAKARFGLEEISISSCEDDLPAAAAASSSDAPAIAPVARLPDLPSISRSVKALIVKESLDSGAGGMGAHSDTERIAGTGCRV